MQIAVSTTKAVEWRGTPQEFSNVYHYDVAEVGGEPAVHLQALTDFLILQEKLIHSSLVTFKQARVWGPTGMGKEASKTLAIHDYSGTGGASPSVTMYKELAIMVNWPLGRYGVRNHPQFLRKWLHTCSLHGYSLDGSSPMNSTPSLIQAYIDAVEDFSTTSGGTTLNYTICTAEGRSPVGPGKSYRYLEHRQLGDQWR